MGTFSQEPGGRRNRVALGREPEKQKSVGKGRNLSGGEATSIRSAARPWPLKVQTWLGHCLLLSEPPAHKREGECLMN